MIASAVGQVNGADFALDPPYALLSSITYLDPPVDDGQFSVGFPVVAGANIATVVVHTEAGAARIRGGRHPGCVRHPPR